MTNQRNDGPEYDAYFEQVQKYLKSDASTPLPRYIIWDSKHPDYPVEWTDPGRLTREGEVGFFRHDIVYELMAEASTEGRQEAYRQGYEQGWHDRACNSPHAYLSGESRPVSRVKTWCAYVAGIIETYLNSNPMPGVREKAIAGIVERRLWALPSATHPVDTPAAPGEGADAMALGQAVARWTGGEYTAYRSDNGEPEQWLKVSIERLGHAVAAVSKSEYRAALNRALAEYDTSLRVAAPTPSPL